MKLRLILVFAASLLMLGCLVNSNNPPVIISSNTTAINPALLITKPLTNLFTQADLASEWQINDSWGNPKYVLQIKEAIQRQCINFSDDSGKSWQSECIDANNTDTTNPITGQYYWDLQNKSQRIDQITNYTYSESSYVLSPGPFKEPDNGRGFKSLQIIADKWPDIPTAKLQYEHALNNAEKYSTKLDVTQVGNDDFAASGTHCLSSVIMFRRNNVVIAITGTNTYPQCVSDDQLSELQRYTVVIDARLQN